MKQINFVPLYVGRPTGKGRPRFDRNGHAYTPTRTKVVEDLCRAKIVQQREATPEWSADAPYFPAGTPVGVVINISFEIAGSWTKAKKRQAENDELLPTSKPDIDNVAKLALDAMNGIVYADDAQIVEMRTVKRYDRLPRVDVCVYEILTNGGPDDD